MNPIADYIEFQHKYNLQYNRYNVVTVKRIGTIDKIVHMNVCKDKGYKIAVIHKGDSNNQKLKNNLVRAKQTVKEIALCNEWKYFVTLTIDGDKLDRYNLSEYKKKLGKFLNNYQVRKNIKVFYLLIPEFHKDGAVHMHGLFSDIPSDDLIVNEYGYLDWVSYHDKFGYISLSEIKSKEKTANYITKYITKSLESHSLELNKHLYMCSKGLKRGECIYKCCGSLKEYQFENEYCKIKEINNQQENFMSFIVPGTYQRSL